MTVINNYETWLQLCRLVNVQQNGQIPPSVFNGWYNEVNKQLFRELCEQFQRDQILTDLLSPFMRTAFLQVIPQTGQNFGIMDAPSDYEYFITLTGLTQALEEECFSTKNLPIIDGTGKSAKYTDPDIAAMVREFASTKQIEGNIRLIDLQRWAACLSHSTKGATIQSPKALPIADGFKIAPKGVVSGLLYYFKTPVNSVFSYTISAQDIAIYDSAGSTQLEWSDQMQPWFLALLVKKYGLAVNQAEIVKMGDDMLADIKNKK